MNLEETGGGAGRDRTDDLGLAKPALSQLSYSPMTHWNLELIQARHRLPDLGRRDGGPGWTRTTDLPLIRRTL